MNLLENNKEFCHFPDQKVHKQSVHGVLYSYVKRWEFCKPCFNFFLLLLKLCTTLYTMVYKTAALNVAKINQ